MSKLGQLLREYREYRGYSLDATACEAGLSKTYVWQLETGRTQNPTVRTINALAYSLSVPRRRLFEAAAIDVEAHDA